MRRYLFWADWPAAIPASNAPRFIIKNGEVFESQAGVAISIGGQVKLAGP